MEKDNRRDNNVEAKKLVYVKPVLREHGRLGTLIKAKSGKARDGFPGRTRS